MGGGPCAWALEAHLRPASAPTPRPRPPRPSTMTWTWSGHGRHRGLRGRGPPLRRRPPDRDDATSTCPPSARALAAFEVEDGFDGLALGCLDHGAAPPGYSDRLFRFDHLRRVVEGSNDLRAFAYLPEEVPEYLTRARAMLACVDTRRAHRVPGHRPGRCPGRAPGPAGGRARRAARPQPGQHARPGLPPARHPHPLAVRAPHRPAVRPRRSSP